VDRGDIAIGGGADGEGEPPLPCHLLALVDEVVPKGSVNLWYTLVETLFSSDSAI